LSPIIVRPPGLEPAPSVRPAHSAANSAAQERRDVARPLCQPPDLDGTAISAVDDEVRPDRPEQDRIRREILAAVPHTGSSPQGFEGVKQFFGPNGEHSRPMSLRRSSGSLKSFRGKTQTSLFPIIGRDTVCGIILMCPPLVRRFKKCAGVKLAGALTNCSRWRLNMELTGGGQVTVAAT